MPSYTYLAVSDIGKQFKGSINANNIDDLEYKLSEIGLELISAKESGSASFFTFSSKIKTKDLILLCTHFEQLDKAGVPISDSIEDLRDSADTASMRDLMQSIQDDVKSGKMLSEAFSMHPKIFDEVFVGLISSGEKTGKLYQAFGYLSEHLKWADDIKRKTKKAIRYPLFLMVVLFSVTAIMMLYVIPKLSDFLLNQNFDLPFYTDKLILKLPFIGSALLKIDVARFTQFFLITFKSGIDIISCIDIVSRVVENKVIKQKLDEMAQDISDGSSISSAIKNTKQFPSLVVRMFEVGEQTGNMASSLENVKFFYDKEVNDAVDSLVGMIQPVLTLVMGGLLLWISLSVFGPLYSSFSNIR